LAALQLYRSYGENTEAKRVLAVLRPAMPKEAFDKLEKSVSSSIELEGRYQLQALGHFETVVKEEKDAAQKAVVLYLCGELNRRLGRWAEAKKFFEAAEKEKGAPEWLAGWLKEQKQRLPKAEK